jgi:hypothetical protein
MRQHVPLLLFIQYAAPWGHAADIAYFAGNDDFD